MSIPYPTVNDQSQVVVQPEDKEVVVPTDPIRDHGLKLSVNQKLAMRHIGKVENKVAVSDEWTYVDGAAVPPAGRNVAEPYMVNDDKKYTSYGNITTTEVHPYGESDSEINNTVAYDSEAESSVANPESESDYTEAVPALAANQDLMGETKIDGRRGQREFDPINQENYLDRPGTEVKTSDTILSVEEAEAESESAETESESETTESETTETEESETTETEESETTETEE